MLFVGCIHAFLNEFYVYDGHNMYLHVYVYGSVVCETDRVVSIHKKIAHADVYIYIYIYIYIVCIDEYI